MPKLPLVKNVASLSTLKPEKLIKKTAEKTTNAIEQTTKSVFDVSSEELGFFMVNGKAIKTIFPR